MPKAGFKCESVLPVSSTEHLNRQELAALTDVARRDTSPSGFVLLFMFFDTF